MAQRRSLSNGGVSTAVPEEQSFLQIDPGRDILPTTTRPQALTSWEVIHSLANRILHSSFYKWFYLSMALTSVVCLVLSFMQKCPSGYFYVLETVVNLAMILEVMIRVQALGKIFWKSVWNVLDLFLVALCVLTLFWLAFGACTAERNWEAELDTFFLVLRNGIQFSRLIVMLTKNGQNMARRTHVIDFSTVDSLSVGTTVSPEINFGAPVSQYGSTSFLDFEGEEGDDFI